MQVVLKQDPRVSSSGVIVRDDSRGSMYSFNGASGPIFTDGDNVWGNFANSDPATAGVDAFFASEKTWDYFLTYGRAGINGGGYQMPISVHNNTFGSFQAFWNGTRVNFGDGDGARPFTPIDIVGHETTHGLTQFTAGLPNMNQGGGLNESFSDIFGTAVEFYTYANTARAPNYIIAEDIGTIRSMSNPRSDTHSLDHFSQYDPGFNEVHYTGGIQNITFYLLAEGGTHPTSGIQVTGIGRVAAENIFYHTLTEKLGPGANFQDAREGSLSAAEDLFGAYSPQWNATSRAWDAAGVFNSIDDARFFVRQHYLDFLHREPDQGGWDYWTAQITQCGNDQVCINNRRTDVSLAFFFSDEFVINNPDFANPNTPTYNNAFVEECYQGYLQRASDPGGKAFWVGVLNNQIPNSDYRSMVIAFITSYEYRLRFVPVGG